MDSARRTWSRVWNDPESRSVLVGILGVLLVHLLLWLFAPLILRPEHGSSVIRPHSSSRQFNIEIAPNAFPKPLPKPPPPKRFVETNPDAPENIPDKTNNFAAQNQQVAQEKPSKEEHNDRPAMEGRKDIQSTQIVDGRLTKPIEQFQTAQPEVDQKQVTQSPPRLEQNPLTGFEKITGNDANGFATGVGKPAENQKDIPNKIEGMKNVPLIQGATSTVPEIDPKHPRARPMLVKSPQTRPAIFSQNDFGTRNVGVIGVSAQFSQYGLYLQRMLNAIQAQWEIILRDSRVYPTQGTHVLVKFKINKEGKITNIIDVDGDAGKQPEDACASSITSRAPYGEWTPDMVQLLGDTQEMSIMFYYE